MRKIILLLFVSAAISSFKIDSKVYVCGSSKVYHPNKSHNSFNNCTHSISEMKESEAISAGKRACKCKR